MLVAAEVGACAVLVLAVGHDPALERHAPLAAE
jgi:hypothetical protein